MQDDPSSPNAAPRPAKDGNILSFRKKPVVENKSDHPPMLNMPEGTKILTFSIVLVHLALVGAGFIFPQFPLDRIYSELGFVAARWTGHAPFGMTAILSLLTVNYLHAGWMHLGINAATLVAFGAGIEKRLGTKDMLLLFFLSSILAVFTHLLVSPSSMEPVIGASGGISGLFGAVMVMMKFDGQRIGVNQRILPMALMWVATSVGFGVLGSPDGSSVAWVAHIGGFFGGMLISWLMLRKKP